MNSPGIIFNYLILGIVALVLATMLVYTFAAKLLHDRRAATNHRLLRQYLLELQSLAQADAAALAAYRGKNPRIVKPGPKRDIFEEALLQTINAGGPAAQKSIEIAYVLGYAQQSVANLHSGKLLAKLRGCQQAGAYLYKPAVPLLFATLGYPAPQLQYLALLALASFKQPQLVMQAFNTIENAILVNNRTVREIVAKMGDKKTELYGLVLQQSSPVLVPLFLRFIDKQSACAYKEQILKLAQNNALEMRVAAVHALAKTGDDRAFLQIVRALRDKQWEVRAAAARGLRKFPAKRVDGVLVKAMGDSAWWVRQNAAASALCLPNPRKRIVKVLRGGDAYAIAALYNAAETMGLLPTVTRLQKYVGPRQKAPPVNVKSAHDTRVQLTAKA